MTTVIPVKVLESHDDASVNFVIPCEDGGFFEARFVQREPSYFIVYLSSHSGCNKSCRFCHLTATRQTMMTPATLDDYVHQAKLVVDHYVTKVLPFASTPASTVHFNFMARGEPFDNPVVTTRAQELYDALADIVQPLNLQVKFKISSIIPDTFSGKLMDVLADPRSRLYYSLYSCNPDFRKRWIGKAKPLDAAGKLIQDYQTETGRYIALHWAFIDGENSSEDDIDGVLHFMEKYNIVAKFNGVRYNPYSPDQGAEASDQVIESLFNSLTSYPLIIPEHSRIVPRVGYDVKASCGMFVS